MPGRITPILVAFSMALAIASPVAAWSDDEPGPTPPEAGLPDRSGPTVREVDDPRIAKVVVDALSGPGETLLSGTLLQSATNPGPPGTEVAAIEEWFVETSEGRVVAIAVPLGPGESGELGGADRGGRRVRLEVRPAGTLEAEARDGEMRRWPLFVGRPLPAEPVSSAGAAVVAATLLAAGGWFLIRRRLASRSGGRGQPVIRSHAGEPEPPMDLPEDPADALAVLAGRSSDVEDKPGSGPRRDPETEA